MPTHWTQTKKKPKKKGIVILSLLRTGLSTLLFHTRWGARPPPQIPRIGRHNGVVLVAYSSTAVYQWESTVYWFQVSSLTGGDHSDQYYWNLKRSAVYPHNDHCRRWRGIAAASFSNGNFRLLCNAWTHQDLACYYSECFEFSFADSIQVIHQ